MTAIPPEAIQAAAAAIAAGHHCDPAAHERQAREAVEAAAPAIAAAERERIRQLAIEHGAQYDIDIVGGLPFTDLIGDPGAT